MEDVAKNAKVTVPGFQAAMRSPGHFDIMCKNDLVDADEAATALAWERIEIDAGTHDLRVSLFDTPGEERVLFDDTIAVAVGETIVLDYRDVPVVVAADAGRDLYFRTALGTTAGCRICHSLEEGETLVGPSLAGVATRAATAARAPLLPRAKNSYLSRIIFLVWVTPPAANR